MEYLNPESSPDSPQKQSKRDFLKAIQDSVEPEIDPLNLMSTEINEDQKLNTGDNFFVARQEEELENLDLDFPREMKRKEEKPKKKRSRFLQVYPEDYINTEADHLKTPRKVVAHWDLARKVYLSKCVSKK